MAICLHLGEGSAHHMGNLDFTEKQQVLFQLRTCEEWGEQFEGTSIDYAQSFFAFQRTWFIKNAREDQVVGDSYVVVIKPSLASAIPFISKLGCSSHFLDISVCLMKL